VTSLSLLIILTTIFLKSQFDISSSMQLFKSLVVELAFEGKHLFCCVILH
jgi:hypothetical protein